MKLWNYKMRFVLALQLQLVNATNALAMIKWKINRELQHQSIVCNHSLSIFLASTYVFTSCVSLRPQHTSQRIAAFFSCVYVFHLTSLRPIYSILLLLIQKKRCNEWQVVKRETEWYISVVLLCVCVCVCFAVFDCDAKCVNACKGILLCAS